MGIQYCFTCDNAQRQNSFNKELSRLIAKKSLFALNSIKRIGTIETFLAASYGKGKENPYIKLNTFKQLNITAVALSYHCRSFVLLVLMRYYWRNPLCLVVKSSSCYTNTAEKGLLNIYRVSLARFALYRTKGPLTFFCCICKVLEMAHFSPTLSML